MKKIIDYLKEARNEKRAIGHFNISETAGLKAIAGAARALSGKGAIFVGLSEGERNFLGVRQAAALVKSLREETDLPLFLNADHTHSLKGAVEAAKAGFDAILFDAGNFPLEENIRLTQKAVTEIKAINPEILVEGELGKIPGGSEVLKDEVAVEISEMVKPEEAEIFVRETGIDLLAPAIGNVHGVFASGKEPFIDLERIAAIAAKIKIPLVLHGASGLTKETLSRAITAGISIVHINTELRLVWRRGLEDSLTEFPDEIAPYKLLARTVKKMEERIIYYLEIFNPTA